MKLKKINRILLLSIILCISALYSVTVGATTLDLSLVYGLGENQNISQTKSYTVKAEVTRGLFHVGVSHRKGVTKGGASDNELLSLIEGSWTQLHAGISSGRGTKLDLALNDDWWIVEICHTGPPVRWGVYAKGCINHRNTRGDHESRKTTGYEIGFGKKINKNQRIEFSVDTSNSSQRFIKDEARFLLGSSWRF